MTVAPVVRSAAVKAPPARAFASFTTQVGRWWPKGRTVGARPRAGTTVGPQSGGRRFETGDEGRQTHRGRVLAWEPPTRLLLTWQINWPAGGGLSATPVATTSDCPEAKARPTRAGLRSGRSARPTPAGS